LYTFVYGPTLPVRCWRREPKRKLAEIDAPLVIAKYISQMELVFQGQEHCVVAQPGKADRSGHVDPPGTICPAAAKIARSHKVVISTPASSS
jgi:hypothetical protein